ncbi:hypothetical protein ACQB6R_13390 [Propionibacteriaceae bacterium G1746]|uniref:hypothetical protein n=1 Tax=Aestuariimicrobium sp. G57 TaxID=3418485 RepID=UPI003C1E9E5D
MGILRASTGQAAANVVAFACTMGIITALPAWAGATRVMDDLDTQAEVAHKVVLRQVRRTLKRDWMMSLLSVVLIFLGLFTAFTSWAYFEGSTRWGLLAGALFLYCIMALLLVNYTHAAGTLPYAATRNQVMDVTMRRIITHPVRALAAVFAVLVCLPLWVLAPLAVGFGITLPAWLVDRVWKGVDTLGVEVTQDRTDLDDEL